MLLAGVVSVAMGRLWEVSEKTGVPLSRLLLRALSKRHVG